MIAIAGKYRCGKSYILSHLIGKQGCFKVGSETNACTQGLWIYNRAIPVKRRDGSTINVLFVDTEGLGDTNKEFNNDLRIFLLATLVSSHLIFNCMRVIDSDMINQLSLVAEMTDRIRLSDSDKHANPDEVEP